MAADPICAAAGILHQSPIVSNPKLGHIHKGLHSYCRGSQGFLSGLQIELSGASAGTGAIGLNLSASNSTVQGLVINRFGGDGILVGGSGNIIQGNYIGTTADGSAAAGN